MHLIERYTRTGPADMEIAVTIEDPMSYMRPWVNAGKKFNLKRDCVFDEEQAYADAVTVPAGDSAPTGK
jgi:hypothetical protein